MNLLPEGFTPEYSQTKGVQQLVDKFNRGDLDYLPNRDKERIAMLAAQYGADFKTPSKPVKKALFDFADTATFGLLPDRWRPTSIGEEYFGESRDDRIAGNVGSLLGLVPSGAIAFKGAKKVRDWWKGSKWSPKDMPPGAVQDKTYLLPERTASSQNQMALLNSGRDNLLLRSGRPNLLQLGAGRFPATPGMTETVDTFNLGRRLY